MIPARYANLLFSLILSGLMSLLVSGIATFRSEGVSEATAGLWIGNWLSGWAVAFPAVLIVAPLARRIAAHLTRADPPPKRDESQAARVPRGG